MTRRCPSWCVTDHATEDEPAWVLHRGRTREVAAVLEGRGSAGPHPAELLVEASRHADEAAVWVYLGDGWTGFSLSLESAERLSATLDAVVREARG